MPVFIDCKHGHMIYVDWSRTNEDANDNYFDVHAVVDIIVYTRWLLEQPDEKRITLAKAIDNVLEIGEWFSDEYQPALPKTNDEIPYANQINLDDSKVRDVVLGYLKPITMMLDLNISED